jgi:hypothetical protein
MLYFDPGAGTRRSCSLTIPSHQPQAARTQRAEAGQMRPRMVHDEIRGPACDEHADFLDRHVERRCCRYADGRGRERFKALVEPGHKFISGLDRRWCIGRGISALIKRNRHGCKRAKGSSAFDRRGSF